MAKIAAITCRTLQEGWCPARHQDEAASAAVLAKCLSARTENSARSSRTRNAGYERSRSRGHQVIRVEKTSSDIASLTRQSAQSDPSLTTVSAAREKETQDSNKSEADHLNYMLQRASLVRAVLMDDVDTIQRVISVLRTR